MLMFYYQVPIDFVQLRQIPSALAKSLLVMWVRITSDKSTKRPKVPQISE